MTIKAGELIKKEFSFDGHLTIEVIVVDASSRQTLTKVSVTQLTWNCRHIANPVIQEGIAEYLEQQTLFLPIICTPEELIGGNNDE